MSSVKACSRSFIVLSATVQWILFIDIYDLKQKLESLFDFMMNNKYFRSSPPAMKSFQKRDFCTVSRGGRSANSYPLIEDTENVSGPFC
jgi:hypothetical protein